MYPLAVPLNNLHSSKSLRNISLIAWYLRPVMWWTTHTYVWEEQKQTRLNFASKTGHLDWYSNNLDLYEISKINIYNFFLLATYAIQSATLQFLLVINSNYGSISDRHDDTRQMTLIWRFKVTKGWTGYLIRSAPYAFPSVFCWPGLSIPQF